MARQIVNIGQAINDGTGTIGPHDWFQKYEANFGELYGSGPANLPTPLIGFFNVKNYGAIGNGVADDTAAVIAAVAAAANGNTIFFPRGNYKLSSTIQVSVKGLAFVGEGFTQSGLQYVGTGSCIQLGTDDGLPYDTGSYNGIADSFAFSGMSLDYTGTKVPLLNGLSTGYGSGTYAIRDWRGGSIRIDRAEISHWDYAFWGIQSDINYFTDLIIAYNHSGIYLGPRSDQCSMSHLWTFGNDQTFLFEGSNGHLVSHWITDADGSATTNPCKIKNAVYSGTRPCEGIIFVAPWLECFDAGTSYDVEAFIEIGVGDLVANGGVSILNPTVAVNLYSTPAVPHTKYLVKADKVVGLTITDPNGVVTVPWNNLRALVEVVNAGASTTVPAIFFQDSTVTTARFIENYSVTSVVAHMNIDANATYTNNVVGGTGNVIMGQLALHRKLVGNNAAVGATTGDITLNRSWNNTGLPYLWVHTGAVNAPFVRESISNDRGDTSQTVTVAVDHPIQFFNTTLTALRTVTLAAGIARGDHFRIVRGASAGGAFNLNVVGATTKSLTAAGQWVDYSYDGANWLETASGAL